MCAEIVNLRQARKRKARADKDRKAEDNRIKFGRTKAEKSLTKATSDLANARLDAHQLPRSDKTSFSSDEDA